MRIKWTLLVLFVCLCTLFTTACDQDMIENAENETQEASDGEINDTPEKIETNAQGEEVSYEDLKGRAITSRAEGHFALSENFDLKLDLSKDWTLVPDAEGKAYDITREGKVIGKIAKGSLQSNEWNVVKEYSNNVDQTLLAKRIIEKKGSGSNTEYRYRFEYNYTAGKDTVLINMCLDYLELDINSAKLLYMSPKVCGASTVRAGMLSDLKDSNCLILGNSFISSSQIGSLLRNMMAVNNKGCSFNAVSRGYATVSTYTSDASMMSEIENGTYDAVFICGFYSSAEINKLPILENACKKSKTELIVFPAHNEHQISINAALKKCPEVRSLDWKGELDLLIASGVNKWDLCVNDQHLHSTPYAGFIGAHMIYRAIYGEMPSINGMSSININDVERIFGNYLKTGGVSTKYEIYKFS